MGRWGDGEMGRWGDGEIGGTENCTFDRNLSIRNSEHKRGKIRKN
ncbi:hypothetical protein [Moorena sp. SIOASIH]|nr:hypothetical protein [Moorena sp. SIOASIH]